MIVGMYGTIQHVGTNYYHLHINNLDTIACSTAKCQTKKDTISKIELKQKTKTTHRRPHDALFIAPPFVTYGFGQ